MYLLVTNVLFWSVTVGHSVGAHSSKKDSIPDGVSSYYVVPDDSSSKVHGDTVGGIVTVEASYFL